MNQLRAGFARINVTPMLGISMSGYYEKREAEGVLDELEVSALAVSDGETTAVLISMDALYFPRNVIWDFKKSITEATGVPDEGIYIHGTHIHTGPTISKDTDEVLVLEYVQYLTHKMADVSKQAIEDLKYAKMGWSVGTAPNVAFIRRYRMKDGSVRTNPGINNPEVAGPLGELDNRVNILRFDREEGETLVLVNYGNHPDVVGGMRFSADWPGFLRRTVEQALPECKCVFFNGCEGDVNHFNVFPKDTDRPLTNVPEEKYQFARYMGRAMAGTVLQEYDKVKYLEDAPIRCMKKAICVPSNMPDPKDIPEAHRLYDMYIDGQEEELHRIYPGMMFETMVARASRMVQLENGPEFFEMDLSAVVIGSVAFIGYPGEPFTGIGKEVKDTEGWELILPTSTTNGAHGYFPMMDAFMEGGYEANSCRMKAGVAELMIKESKEMLEKLRMEKKSC